MVTLTTGRILDPLRFSRLLSELLHRLNTRLFGTSYSRHRRVQLATYAVQERSYSDGLHTHLLVGIPEGSLELKPHQTNLSLDDLIKQTWCGLEPFACPEGQDIQRIYHLVGAANYLGKGVRRLPAFDNVDVLNCRLPSVPPTVPT